MQPPPRILPRPEAQDLQNRLPSPLTEDHTLILLERDPPNGITWPGEFPDERPRPRVPELDTSVVPAGNDETLVKLEAGDRVVVRAETVDALEGGEVEDDDPAVGATGDEAVVSKLKLANKGSMALEEDDTVAEPASAASIINSTAVYTG